MVDQHFIFVFLKVLIAVSILFVWVIRYKNIVTEFEGYGFPNWFRDSMGIIKCTAAVMLLYGTVPLTILAASVLSFLMLAAFITHIKFRHSFIEMLPSFILACASSVLFYGSIIQS